MNALFRLLVFLCVAMAGGCAPRGKPVEPEVARIAFGSCLHQDLPAPIWEAVLTAEPDVWIWLGDTIYGDSADPEVLAAAYGKVKSHPDYGSLREKATVLATWDDHDYGRNNGGKEWEGKAVAQEALLDFLGEPADSARRSREGVYASYEFGEGERKVKALMLDVRSHRDSPSLEGGDIFGAAQRRWIARELEGNDAALTVICSGTQVIPEDHGYERWAQFPEARKWFFDQLAASGTGAVLFLSGDRHIAEISKLEWKGSEKAFYEVTSSSMTHAWTDFPGEPNRHRIGEVYSANNFGLLEIDWERRVATVSIRDESGAAQRELVIEF